MTFNLQGRSLIPLDLHMQLCPVVLHFNVVPLTQGAIPSQSLVSISGSILVCTTSRSNQPVSPQQHGCAGLTLTGSQNQKINVFTGLNAHVSSSAKTQHTAPLCPPAGPEALLYFFRFSRFREKKIFSNNVLNGFE